MVKRAKSGEVEVIRGRYEFTDEEKSVISKKLAEAQIKSMQIEEELKAIKAEYKDKLERLVLEINVASRAVYHGWEMRDYKCDVEYDYANNEKYFLDNETHRLVEKRAFEKEDFQRKMEFAGPQAKPVKSPERKPYKDE